MRRWQHGSDPGGPSSVKRPILPRRLIARAFACAVRIHQVTKDDERESAPGAGTLRIGAARQAVVSEPGLRQVAGAELVRAGLESLNAKHVHQLSPNDRSP